MDESWTSEVRHFLDCVKNDSPVAYGSSADALQLMQLIDRTYASSTHHER